MHAVPTNVFKYMNALLFYLLKEEKGTKLSLFFNYHLFSFFIRKFPMSSRKTTGPRIKHCQHIALPSTIMQAPPPPCTDLPPSINDIPTTTVTLKMTPLPPPPHSAPPPKKKHSSGSHLPFFDGVYGRPLFSLTPVNHFSAIPEGKSIIFNYYRKALPHEVSEGSSYILINIFENLWMALEVFLKW